MKEALLFLHDILSFINPRHFSKLFTHEDSYNIHKILGICVLIHYSYRFYNLFFYGSMAFDYNNIILTFGSIVLHLLLSFSSLIFKLPSIRLKSKPIMYQAFRLHNIIFATRSLISMFIILVANYLQDSYILYAKIIIIELTMYYADKVTKAFSKQGSTIRDMPFPSYIPMYIRHMWNIWYSLAQFYGTIIILYSNRIDEAFLVLFPIQIASFFMTCVRKQILSSGGYHFLYSLSIILVGVLSKYQEPFNYFSRFNVSIDVLVIICVCIRISFHKIFDINIKYMLWLLIACLSYPIRNPFIIADYHMYCSTWAEIGECESNKVYMHHMCKQSCSQ